MVCIWCCCCESAVVFVGEIRLQGSILEYGIAQKINNDGCRDNMFDDGSIKEFINSNWRELCTIAYRNYLQMGRGLIGVQIRPKNADGIREAKMVYGVFKDAEQIGDDVFRMIAVYNPEDEFLVQYISGPGKVSTLRIEPGKNKTPLEIWNESNQAVDQ